MFGYDFFAKKNYNERESHMLNKKSIKTILNVKHTCIDNVKILADSSIMIEVHATKGQQCRCGICGKKSKFYDNGNQGARTWRACDWAGHKIILVAPSSRVKCKEHGVVTCQFPWDIRYMPHLSASVFRKGTFQTVIIRSVFIC